PAVQPHRPPGSVCPVRLLRGTAADRDADRRPDVRGGDHPPPCPPLSAGDRLASPPPANSVTRTGSWPGCAEASHELSSCGAIPAGLPGERGDSTRQGNCP